MAQSKNNAITKGASGKFADVLVFTQRHGKTILGKVPVRTGEPTPDQLAVREKFHKAVRYARISMQDASIKPLYEKRAGGGITAFNLAIVDYFSAPVIDDINTGGYAGTAGSTIEVTASDDTKVDSVRISIYNPAGNPVEEGDAVLDPSSGHWLYTATAANGVLAGSKIIAKAKDLPGNEAKVEKLLS